jgi:hypothetical protein
MLSTSEPCMSQVKPPSHSISAPPSSVTLLAVVIAVAATGPLSAQPTIPIRRLTAVASTDSGVIDGLEAIHVLSDGRVFLDDLSRRRLLLFDSTLKRFTIVADTAAGAPMPFGLGASSGSGNGAILSFPGDSVAFVDIDAKSLTIIDAKGHFGRITTPPIADDMFSLARGDRGVPGFDSRGRLYYRVESRLPLPKRSATKEGADTSYVHADSAAILRANFDTRGVDTVAKLYATRRARVIRSTVATPQGYQTGLATYAIVDPLPSPDEWAYLPDGTVAIVRGHDYHIDWFLPDGSRESTPKMPFDWRRITDEEKHRTVDSVRHRIDSAYDATIARLSKANPGLPASSLSRMAAHPDVVAWNELPDYYPPVRAGSQMQADPEGNLWILPTTSLQAKGGFLYDVVNRKGEIIERVQFPEGRALAGFGPKGIVYMQVPAGYSWARLERAHIN